MFWNQQQIMELQTHMVKKIQKSVNKLTKTIDKCSNFKHVAAIVAEQRSNISYINYNPFLNHILSSIL